MVETIATDNLPEDWRERQLLTEQIRAMTNGKGADAVVDVLPTAPEVTVQSMLSMRKGGTTILAGGNHNELVLPYTRIMQGGYQIKGSNGYVRRDAQELIQLLQAHRLDVSALITHRFALSEANQAVETIWERKGNPRFVMVNPPL
jgi:threonine dehydrogenase-like Zn-dependent dehydrogenase